ncbi:hypothetical protein ACWEN6_37665 [Sphaerisporangium sp. NPDC004334]
MTRSPRSRKRSSTPPPAPRRKQAAAQRSAAPKRGRRRLATLSADQEDAEAVRRISPAEAERAQRGQPQPDLRREASASLLGLAPIGPIELVDLAHLDVREQGRQW